MRSLLILLISLCGVAWADNLPMQVQDRTAIERVYYSHRLGDKRPFQQVSSPALIEQLVRQDLQKQAVLKKAYGVTITPAMLEQEVHRIDASTRAPEMLAEIKAALGNDPERFAQAYAKRFLVDRLLRERFENDDALHAPVRHECESARSELLAAKTNGATAAELLVQLRQDHSNEVTETTWELVARPAVTNMPAVDEMEIKKRFGPDAQILSPPQGREPDRKFYFGDLPPKLQQVLRVQLRQPGDISAVIESLRGFLLYVCQEKTDQTLKVACLSLPKRSYEHWLADQGKGPQ